MASSLKRLSQIDRSVYHSGLQHLAQSTTICAMGGRVLMSWLWAVGVLAYAQDSSQLLDRVRARIRESLSRIPNYVCLQTIERSHRSEPNGPFRARDVLRVDVGVSGNRELHAWPDAGSLGE